MFLDRGELDKLLDEAAQPPLGGLADEADRLTRDDRDPRYGDARYRDDDDDRGSRGGRRRRGWLDDVFDFD